MPDTRQDERIAAQAMSQPAARVSSPSPAVSVAGDGGGAPPPGAAEAWRRAAAEVRFDRKMALFSLTMQTCTHLMSLWAWVTVGSDEPAAIAQRLMTVALTVAMYAVPTISPVFYLRHRAKALTIYRLAFFSFPFLRKSRGMQRVLDADPLPGVHGTLTDLLKLVWGSRLILLLLSSILMPLPLLPLLPHLGVQLFSVALVRSNGTLCAAPLLAHPRTARRIAALHNLLRLLVTALPGAPGQSVAAALHGSSPERQCDAFIDLLFACLGFLLPLAVLLKTEPAHSMAAWQARAAAAEASGGGLRAVGRRAAVGLEAALRQLCGPSWFAQPPALSDTSDEWGSMEAPSTASESQQPRGGSGGGGSGEGALSCRIKRWPKLQGWQRWAAWWLLLSLVWALAIEKRGAHEA